VPSTDGALHDLPAALAHWPGYLLAFVGEQATARFEAALAHHGIRSKHAAALVVVAAEGPMSQRALGRRLRIDKSPMVGLVDDLERLGLAERGRSESDRRVRTIRLTTKGRSVVRSVTQAADAENERTFAALDDDERALLHRLLLRLADGAGAG
jgi:MarR family transcriptional regulator, lower aerobic nicotinate degradation pathway regulator